MSPDPIARRNAGLRRISTITKGAMAGGLLLTGGLSVLAARSFSGTSTAATQTTTQSTATQSTQTQSTTAAQSTTATTAPTVTTAPTTRATTNTTQQTLQSPSYSVRTSNGSGRVSSGGS